MRIFKILVFSLLCFGFVTPVLATNTQTDWPMAGADPQRTSHNSVGIAGNLNVEWYRVFQPFIDEKVQVVAANNKVYISTTKGLVAFNVDGTCAWSTTEPCKGYWTELPPGHSPSIATINGKAVAYLPGFDHRVQAIDANTGDPIAGYTPYEADAGFETNPLVINDGFASNLIVAGNRDGNLYGLDAVTGAKRWQFPTNGPIRFSPAYKNGVVYIASDDSYAYAVNVANGNQVWKSAKLPGYGFMDYWPVIWTDTFGGTGDYVIYSGSKIAATYDWWGTGSAYHDEDLHIPSCTPGTTSYLWNSSNTTVLDCTGIHDYFAASPDNKAKRNFIILQSGNGVEAPYLAPVSWSGAAHGSNKYPPTVGGDGVLYTHIGHSFGSGNGNCGGWISGWKFGTGFISQIWNDSAACDEPPAFTSGGNFIYWGEGVNHEAWGKVDITGSMVNGANFSNWPDLRWLPGASSKYWDNPTTNNLQLTSIFGSGKNGVYSYYDGVTNQSPVPFSDQNGNRHLFIINGNTLFALKAGTTTPVRKNDIPVPTQVNPANITLSPAKVTAILENEVSKMISAGHLRPGYYNFGYVTRFLGQGYVYNVQPDYHVAVAGDRLTDYFHRPGDTLIALIGALTTIKQWDPTNTNLQTQLINYIKSEEANYGVETYSHTGWQNGAAREAFDMPTFFTNAMLNGVTNDMTYNTKKTDITYLSNTSATSINIGTFPADAPYAAWKYAKEIDPTKAAGFLTAFDQNNKFQLKSQMSQTDLTDWPYILNQYIAGYRGYMELEVMAGRITNISQSSKYADYLMLLDWRTNGFSKDSPFSNYSYTEYMNNYVLNVARNFMSLTPELGADLKVVKQTAVHTALDEYNLLEPFWFVPKYSRTYEEGLGQPLFDKSLMLGKAYADGQGFSELVKYLDVPAFQRGDLFYLQSLVATLQAPTGPTPTPGPITNTPVPSATPTPAFVIGNGDADGNGSVNGNDIKAILGSWFTSVNPLTNILNQYNDNNGFINSFDFAVVASHLQPVSGNAYYISPTGNDNNSGTSTAAPLATFTKAWTKLTPGDTLYLMDGTYTEVLQPNINGSPAKYITVKAFNDGKAIIDGQNGSHQTVVLGTTWDNIPGYTRDTINPVGNWFDIEGIVAKNSSKDVYEVYSRNVILRRNSGYNANPHDNYHVFTVWSLGTPANPANVLLEDNVAAGSGRKMLLAYDTYVNVVLRRNFAAWQWWLGDAWCTSSGGLPYWPQSDGIEIYPKAYDNQPDVTNNTFVENNILFGLTPDYGFSQNPNPGNSIGNNYFGDIALGSGMLWDNNQAKFILPSWTVSTDRSTCSYNGISKPAACSNTQCIGLENGIYRSGFDFESSCSQKGYITSNNIIQDFFSSQNANKGLATTSCGWGNGASNNTLVRATLINNLQSDVNQTDLDLFTSVSDAKIGDPSYTGGGANLQYQYVNGSLTSTKLWPWPMENRIKTEFADPSLFQANKNGTFVQWNNFSVTQNVCQNILLPNGAVSTCQ